MNIFEKLSKITSDLSTVAKNLEVGVGQSKYKAVGEADVLRTIKPLEARYKVYSYPVSRRIVESGILENESVTKDGKTVVRKNLYERIEVVYRFVDIEKPEDYIEIVSYGDGIDSQDKSVGKAMTYADKYALMKAYKIITGDDPDQEESKETRNIQIKNNLSQSVIEYAKLANVDLNKLAAYLKKSVSELTDQEVEDAANRKMKAKAQ